MDEREVGESMEGVDRACADTRSNPTLRCDHESAEDPIKCVCSQSRLRQSVRRS